jgi:hypothetical protein
MKTGQDALESGVYESNCCEYQVIFDKGALLWRCPNCKRLCNWELAETDLTEIEIAKLERATAEPPID